MINYSLYIYCHCFNPLKTSTEYTWAGLWEMCVIENLIIFNGIPGEFLLFHDFHDILLHGTKISHVRKRKTKKEEKRLACHGAQH